MESNCRIKFDMSMLDIFMAMSEGNPGALRVCSELFAATEANDPDAVFGGLAPLMDLDMAGIYGPRIWMLYKDICGQDIAKTNAMLRAWQLGYVDTSKLLDAIDSSGRGIDVPALLAQVKERLPAIKTSVAG